mgnify:CR=1 FL=1
MPQPALGIWFCGPLPVSAICFIDFNKSLSPSFTGTSAGRHNTRALAGPGDG